MSGGGGSDGGGSSTVSYTINYADYIRSQHIGWLPIVGNYWTSAKDAAPYSVAAGGVAFDPDTDIDSMLAALNAYCNVLLNFHNDSLDIAVVATAFDEAMEAHTFVPRTAWATNLTSAISSIDAALLTTTEIDESVDQYSEQLQADIEEKVLPVFEAGMRDINAVMSSAFLIGEALIFAEKDRNVAKYASDLRLANWGDRNKAIINTAAALTEEDIKMLGVKIQIAEMTGKFFIQGTEYKRLLTDKIVDVLRMKIVAKKEETDENTRLRAEAAKWGLVLTQYMGSMLGAAGGGHAVPNATGSSGSSVATTLGGVMAGASIGAMFNSELGGGGWGTTIGAGLGGLATLM